MLLKIKIPNLNENEIETLKDSLKYLKDNDYAKFKKEVLLHYMKQEKGLLFGRLLAEELIDKEIPKSFKVAIKKAKLLSEGSNGD